MLTINRVWQGRGSRLGPFLWAALCMVTGCRCVCGLMKGGHSLGGWMVDEGLTSLGGWMVDER